MATENYRTDKKQLPAFYLDGDEYDTVMKAFNKAAEKTGVTNNRKNRLALIEICRSYLDDVNSKKSD